MRIDLSGRTALVTGSTQGIGLAIATGLAAAGARVAINGRDRDKVLAALPAEGDFVAAPADLTTDDGLATLLAELPQVDILVNNLGIFGAQPALEITDAEWRRYFEVNVLTGVRLTRAYLPGMRERGWGRIQYIASDSAVVTPTEMIHYGMTKTAQLAVARGIAESVAASGVTVNSVLPGPTASEGVSGFVDDLARTQGKDRAAVEADFFREMRPSSLIKRFATPEEVASLVTYVCSVQASATTGASLRVDGGVLRSIA